MRHTCFILLSQCLITTLLLAQSNVPLVNPANAIHEDSKDETRILDGYGKLPLSFEANQGQADAHVKFLSRTSGYSLFLTEDEAVLVLNGKKAIMNQREFARVGKAMQSDRAEPEAGACYG